MIGRMAMRIIILMLALTGCATTGNPLARADRSTLAAKGCFEAADGRIEAGVGLKLCNFALADRALAPSLHAATLVNRGALFLQNEDFAAALADFDAAIAAKPGDAEAYVNKGIALLHVGGRDAEAVAVLTEALDREPKRPELVYYHRAAAYEGLGRLRDAYDDYAEAAQLAPGWAEPANQLQRFKVVKRKTLAG